MIELKVLKRDTKDSNDYLRSHGLIPAVMYGPGFDNISISVNDGEFRKVYREAGTSNVIHTIGDIKGEMIIVQDMDVHVVSGDILSIDFKVVNKGETTEITVPIKLVGESLAVKNNIGLLNFSHEEVVIETIPSKIPDHIEVDISELNGLGDNIKLSDIKFQEGVKCIDDIEITVVSIISPQEEKTEDDNIDIEPELVNQKGGEKEDSLDKKDE